MNQSSSNPFELAAWRKYQSGIWLCYSIVFAFLMNQNSYFILSFFIIWKNIQKVKGSNFYLKIVPSILNGITLTISNAKPSCYHRKEKLRKVRWIKLLSDPQPLLENCLWYPMQKHHATIEKNNKVCHQRCDIIDFFFDLSISIILIMLYHRM